MGSWAGLAGRGRTIEALEGWAWKQSPEDSWGKNGACGGQVTT